MRALQFLLAICSILFATSSLAVELPKTLVANGETFDGVTYQSHTRLQLTIMHESGIASIPIGSLPVDLREKLGYDEGLLAPPLPEWPGQQARPTVAQPRKTGTAQIKQFLDDESETIVSRVFQVVPDGVIIDSAVASQFKSFDGPGMYGTLPDIAEGVSERAFELGWIATQITSLSKRKYVFVRTDQPGLTDGSIYTGTIYPIGTYTDETAVGGSKTLRAFADTPEVAVAQIKQLLQLLPEKSAEQWFRSHGLWGDH